jgi:hypothetical protein
LLSLKQVYEDHLTLKRESKAEGSEYGVLTKNFERREKSNYIKRREN